MKNIKPQLSFNFDTPQTETKSLSDRIISAINFPEEPNTKPKISHSVLLKDFHKKFEQLAGLSHQPIHKIFEDFCLMGTCIVHNFGMQETLLSPYMPQYEKRHTEYHERAKIYNNEQIILFLETIKNLAELFDQEPDDYLGQYFMNMGFDKHFHGQFFTPIHICEMMAKMTFSKNFEEEIADTGYASLSEPACGSGAMIIGAVRTMKEYNVNNLGGKLIIYATDIDRLCVNMAYLQLGTLGLSARIVHGNTLTMESWDYFDTPNLQINRCLGHFN